MRRGGEASRRLAAGINPLPPAANQKLPDFAGLESSFRAHVSSHEGNRRTKEPSRPPSVAMGAYCARLFLAASLLLAANPAQAESAREAVARLHEQMSQGDSSAETWRQLAHALAETGDLAGAEAALLTSLKQDPHSAAALRDLGKLYIDTNRTREALPVLEQALSRASEDQETRDALSYVLYQTGDAVRSLEVSNRGQPLGPAQAEALVEAARFYTEWGHPDAAERALAKAHELAPNSLAVSGALLERSQSKTRAEQPVAPTEGSPSLGTGESTAPSPGVRAPQETSRHLVGKDLPRLVVVGLACSAALLVLAALRISFMWLRGSGDLAVTIDYPQERKGSFSVRLLRHSARVRRRADPPRARAREGERPAPVRVSSRLEHTLVTRETQFRSLSARRWFVWVEGTLEADAASPPAPIELAQEVRVERGRVAQARFDLRGEECAIEVHVVKDKQPATKTRVGLRGEPSSLKYTREGRIRLTLAPGRYGIVIAGVDRVLERPIAVRPLEGQRLEIELSREADAVFSGCEAAVEPYLQGDFAAAATALEREGKHSIARLLRAEHHRARGEMAEAAALYERAGRWVDAAELREGQGELAQAARLFERAGDLLRAAEHWRAAGDLLRAGEAFSAAEEYGSAADCFREAGATAQLLGVLEKGGAFLAAGELALAQGQAWRSIRNLEQVDPRDPVYAGACELLATALTREGQIERAIQVLEDIRHRDPGRLEIAAKLETLRQKVTERSPGEAGASA